jgi:uncharacterized protein YceH (UPF0502 family)
VQFVPFDPGDIVKRDEPILGNRVSLGLKRTNKTRRDTMSDQELEDKIQELKREIDILNARIASLVDDPMWRTLEEFERRRKKDLEYWKERR